MSTPEISYDLVMDGEMDFVEGTYRLAGRDWQVLIFTRCDIPEPILTDTTWQSGVTGLHIAFPQNRTLNQSVVERLLGSHFNVQSWQVVHGPDSMVLR